MTTEIRFFALKSKKEKVLDRGQNVFNVKTTIFPHNRGMLRRSRCVLIFPSLNNNNSSITLGLPLTSLCDLPLLLFFSFQVNNGVLYFLDYVEDIYIMGPLCSRFNVVTSSSQPM